MAKITIIEGNSNDKDKIRAFLVKGEKGDKGDKGEDGTGTKLSDLENDMGFVTDTEIDNLINTAVNEKMLLMYPIGSIYFTANNVNPSTFIGGYWERIAEGQFIAGVGTGTDMNNAEKTIIAGANAGEYEHTLTTNEMPKHKHTLNWTPTQSRGQIVAEGNLYLGSTNYTMNTSEQGNDEAHNVTPPSFGLYAWQRVEPPQE